MDFIANGLWPKIWKALAQGTDAKLSGDKQTTANTNLRFPVALCEWIPGGSQIVTYILFLNDRKSFRFHFFLWGLFLLHRIIVADAFIPRLGCYSVRWKVISTKAAAALCGPPTLHWGEISLKKPPKSQVNNWAGDLLVSQLSFSRKVLCDSPRREIW